MIRTVTVLGNRLSNVSPKIEIMSDMPSGAAFTFLDEVTGENAIIVYTGAADTISVADVEKHRDVIKGATVFVIQLEQPADAALMALRRLC